MLLGGCLPGQDPPPPTAATALHDTVRSPSGGYTAAYVDDPTLSDRVAIVAPVIRDTQGAEVYRDDDMYSMWQGIALVWAGDTDLWVLTPRASSVVRHSGGQWVETEGATPPAEVEQRRPAPPERG